MTGVKNKVKKSLTTFSNFKKCKELKYQSKSKDSSVTLC